MLSFYSIKMRVFQSIQTYFSILGINSDQSHKKNLFNAKNVIALVILCVCIVINSMYIIFEANTIDEYAKSVFMTTTSIVSILILAANIWRMAYFFKYINGLEQLIKNSKSFQIKFALKIGTSLKLNFRRTATLIIICNLRGNQRKSGKME